MKKLILITTSLLSVLALSLQSCDKVKDEIKKRYATDINWDGADVNFTLDPQTDTTNNIMGAVASFSYNLDSLIKDKTSGYLGIGDISAFYITSASINITDADADNNFANFSMAGLYFNTNVNTTTYKIEMPNNPNTYATNLNLPVDATADLKSYVNSGSTIIFNYIIGGKLRKATTKTLHGVVHVSYKFHVGE